jgi:translation initiation factor IF-2
MVTTRKSNWLDATPRGSQVVDTVPSLPIDLLVALLSNLGRSLHPYWWHVNGNEDNPESLCNLLRISGRDMHTIFVNCGLAKEGFGVGKSGVGILIDKLGEPCKRTEYSPKLPVLDDNGQITKYKSKTLQYASFGHKETENRALSTHINHGAYDVVTESGKRVAFLDTPGHEAFTAMRARGTKVTDIVIVVVAADDRVMPQTKEPINHAQLAGVPIVIAINKMDKPEANPDKIKEELSGINILVEDWGGKYQSQAISAKTGQGIKELLEKVLLEAELLALQANPNKRARGTVLEAFLDQGRGYVSTLMVQSGTLKVGDVVLAGAYYGKVKAMTDYLTRHVQEAIPSTPVQVLGLNGPPQAGDTFRVTTSDKEAREAAIYKQQIMREQSLRTRTHITLDEIGRRLAIGSFKELNIILKGDVDGSVEALADALLKLSTEEIQVNIIYKSVGAMSQVQKIVSLVHSLQKNIKSRWNSL